MRSPFSSSSCTSSTFRPRRPEGANISSDESAGVSSRSGAEVREGSR
jgi:hypothetical protein